MSVEIRVPRLAESISDAVLVEWLKPDEAVVGQDEPVATLETDKAAVEIAAGAAGRLRHGSRPGDRVIVGQVIGTVEPGAGVPAERAASAAPAPPAAPVAAVIPSATRTQATSAENAGDGGEPMLSPAVRRLIEEHGLDPLRIRATGRGGRLIKEDVLRHLEEADAAGSAPVGEASPVPAPAPASAPAAPTAVPHAAGGAGEEEERAVPMSRIRLRIAERLVRAQHTAAILTTFNEIDMTAVQELRARYRDSFEKRHGVRLGLLSFFARATTLALADIPEINAEIRDTDIVYRKHVHLGIAVGTDRGLVVPVVRGADRLDFAGLERDIARLASRARDRSLTLDELSGGTFTISNGGVYGSLLSTPILNPPQSGILGLHKIQKRPIAAGDQVVIRPMMYVALSYDHRIVDGEQAVSFLIRIKERLEDPERMLLDV